MNTRHAQLVLAVAREGSFTAAAKSLFIAQPTLSQQIRQIEQQLGAPIFERGTTPVSLTPAGQIYVQAARRFLQIETQMNESIAALSGHTAGLLRLGLPQQRADELLPQVLAEFQSVYPEVCVQAVSLPNDELERKLREGVVTAVPAQKSAKAAPIDAPAAQTEAPEIAKEAPQGPAADAERIWQDAMRQAKQKPQLFGMLKFGRLVSGDNGLFTVVYPRATGGAYVKMLSMAEKNAEVADYLTKAAGYSCTFRAAIEGTVQESDKAILAAQEEAQKQAENSLNKVFDMFGRENVRVKDE